MKHQNLLDGFFLRSVKNGLNVFHCKTQCSDRKNMKAIHVIHIKSGIIIINVLMPSLYKFCVTKVSTLNFPKSIKNYQKISIRS